MRNVFLPYHITPSISDSSKLEVKLMQSRTMTISTRLMDGAEVQIVGVAKELQLDQIADQQVGAAAQHTADNKSRDRGHKHLRDAGGNAGAGQRDEHPKQNMLDVAAQILRGLNDGIIDFCHGRVDGQNHKRQVVVHHAQHNRT